MNMYEAIGNKIQSSLNLFAGDVVVWLSLDGMSVTTLYRIDDGYGQWEDDWYEGQKDVQLIDYCLLDVLKPVIHAHWETDKHAALDFCSSCGESVERYVTAEQMDKSNYKGATYWNYCPHCGAKMDEEVDDE